MAKTKYPLPYHHLFTRPGISARDKLYKDFFHEYIEYEKTACLGRCPVFKVKFFKNGNVEYIGKSYVEKIGNYQGHLHIKYFGKLSLVIQELKIDRLKKKQGMDATCISDTILRIKPEGEDIIEIVDRGECGPIELWAVQQIIERMLLKVTWKK